MHVGIYVCMYKAIYTYKNKITDNGWSKDAMIHKYEVINYNGIMIKDGRTEG